MFLKFKSGLKLTSILLIFLFSVSCTSQIKQVLQALGVVPAASAPVPADAPVMPPVQPVTTTSTAPQDPDTFVPVNQGAVTAPSNFPTTATARSVIDSKSQVELKAGWAVTTGLNDKADIQIESVSKNLYFISLTEAKENLDKSIFFEKYSELTRENLIRPLTDVRYSAPVYKTIGGRKALQYEITAKSDNLDIWYFHTIVETPQNFHQLISWTLKDSFSPNRIELESVIDSFKEL